MKILYCYLLIINALVFTLMLLDKRKAKKRQWRIPERVLLGTAAIGGSLGGILGMYLVRHKTKHPRFSFGLPAMLIVHAIMLFLAHRFF